MNLHPGKTIEKIHQFLLTMNTPLIANYIDILVEQEESISVFNQNNV